MKASDAIAELQALIDVHGDLDVKYYDYKNGLWYNPMIYFCVDRLTGKSHLEDFIALDMS